MANRASIPSLEDVEEEFDTNSEDLDRKAKAKGEGEDEDKAWEDGTAAYLKKRFVEMVWWKNTVDEVKSVAGGETGESAENVTSGEEISSAESIASTEAITATEMEAVTSMEAVTPMEAIISPDDITSEEAIASLEEIVSTKYETLMRDTTSATGEQKGETAIIDYVNGSMGGTEGNVHSEKVRSDPDRCSFGNASVMKTIDFVGYDRRDDSSDLSDQSPEMCETTLHRLMLFIISIIKNEIITSHTQCTKLSKQVSQIVMKQEQTENWNIK
ncbi:hypothetical protein MBM_07014 [Drepanopeziza brunnea f. sp. 'multigermtubi' MB_m1]|uniref:Uncharacterized protein n=1 Tax=Marssonina brunnea f. sp. multigermtubi (strain MB_m1) TaxID=1072389 RepID=K1X1X0_MARBU|nr:uncharacterized protein MBM_07014 [Drepanopeziza brunnea f. sp. 'multigermtubi' MB_m1]EKD14803.1 hypothetical protein MBM_07014 [Drepanopeziza brunnea f. sp. 'multigermtubi' MB_m1]